LPWDAFRYRNSQAGCRPRSRRLYPKFTLVGISVRIDLSCRIRHQPPCINPPPEDEQTTCAFLVKHWKNAGSVSIHDKRRGYKVRESRSSCAHGLSMPEMDGIDWRAATRNSDPRYQDHVHHASPVGELRFGSPKKPRFLSTGPSRELVSEVNKMCGLIRPSKTPDKRKSGPRPCCPLGADIRTYVRPPVRGRSSAGEHSYMRGSQVICRAHHPSSNCGKTLD